MDFASIRMISDDLEPVVRFYEQVTGVPAVWPAPVFAEVHLPSCTIAFGHTQTAQLFNNSARPADNHTVIIEFLVDDVDKEFERLKTFVSEWVQPPTTMPWGNRSILFRDPDGNLVNLFTPFTQEATKRFSGPIARTQAAPAIAGAEVAGPASVRSDTRATRNTASPDSPSRARLRGLARTPADLLLPNALASVWVKSARPRSSGETEGRVAIGEEADVGLDPQGIAIDVDEEAPYPFGYSPVTSTANRPTMTATHRRRIERRGRSSEEWRGTTCTAASTGPGGRDRPGAATCGISTPSSSEERSKSNGG